jgi:ferritin-like protein
VTSEGTHEPFELLSPATRERHRAVVSLIEELEAVDWYDQRVDASDDEELAAVLAHNRDEEKEHAAMTLEWLRRRDPVLDQQLRTYLFREGPVLEAEAAATDAGPSDAGPSGSSTADGSLGIGSLRHLARIPATDVPGGLP